MCKIIIFFHFNTIFLFSPQLCYCQWSFITTKKYFIVTILKLFGTNWMHADPRGRAPLIYQLASSLGDGRTLLRAKQTKPSSFWQMWPNLATKSLQNGMLHAAVVCFSRVHELRSSSQSLKLYKAVVFAWTCISSCLFSWKCAFGLKAVNCEIWKNVTLLSKFIK